MPYPSRFARNREDELEHTAKLGPIHCLSARENAELAVDRMRVSLYGIEREVELGPYLALRKAGLQLERVSFEFTATI